MSLDFDLYTRINLGGPETFKVRIDSFNVTHNLRPMARECGLYKPLWIPDESYPTPVLARDLIEPVREGLNRLLSNRDLYHPFEPPNGWGSYDDLVDFATSVLNSIERYPLANVSVSR